LELIEFDDYGSDLDESNTIEDNYKRLFGSPTKQLEWVDSLQNEFLGVKKAVSKLRTLRNKQNGQTKMLTNKRNELNIISKEIREKVNQLVQLRNLENEEVKNLKKVRKEKELRIKDIKDRLAQDPLLEDKNSLKKDLSKVVKEHSEIHSQVQERAKDAQLSHENIQKNASEQNKTHTSAQNCHNSMKSSKKAADKIHNIFIQFMNRQNELVELLNKHEGE
jgi:uncharacterized coiled-coil DUF342 family protein